MASTNLKRDAGNTEKSLCNRVHLLGVNILLVSMQRTDLCECNSVFNTLIHSRLGRSVHQWRVFL